MKAMASQPPFNHAQKQKCQGATQCINTLKIASLLIKMWYLAKYVKVNTANNPAL